MSEQKTETFITNEEGKKPESDTVDPNMIDHEKMKQALEEKQRIEEEERVRKRQEQALLFEKYLEESGLSLSFQIIFTELI